MIQAVVFLVDRPSPGYRAGLLLGGLLLFALALALYTLPTMLAVQRRSDRTLAVVLIDFFLGWTVVGWMVALVVALGSGSRPVGVPAPQPTPVPVPISPPLALPDAIEWTGGPAGKPAPHPADFRRSAERVAILSLFAPASYGAWWFWQFWKLARREAFPHARAFWWILVPVYGLVVVYRALEDLEQRQPQAPRGRGFDAGVAIALLTAAGLVVILSLRADLLGLLLFILGGLLFALVAFLVQQGANAYLAHRYPAEPPRGMTGGEFVATVIGVLLFAVVTLFSLLPVDTSQSLL